MKIFSQLERWKTRRAFRKLVSPEVSSKLAKLGEPTEKIEKKHFQFLLVNLQDNVPDEVPAAIGKIVTTIAAQSVPIWYIDSSLMTIVLGVPFAEMDSSELRFKLVSTLLREHSKLVRIVHGHCDGMVGVYGAKPRWTYGCIIPQFSGTLKRLLDSEFGTAIEIVNPKVGTD